MLWVTLALYLTVGYLGWGYFMGSWKGRNWKWKNLSEYLFKRQGLLIFLFLSTFWLPMLLIMYFYTPMEVLIGNIKQKFGRKS